ncbi:MBL fold metallo-hydrolase [Sphaerisporangium rhizosphaerae]|uniref:MBL fold metallo-hydrolase n=1 Tax=Sphaerisporangium rhizosphaerae TaxID=2269375 RepID=A0ABW2PHA3_9ACTN
MNTCRGHSARGRAGYEPRSAHGRARSRRSCEGRRGRARSVFFGGEIAEVAPLERYRAEHPPVDVALLPVNGLRPLFGPRLVMGPAQAVAGARAVGAEVLIPVHDAHGRDPLSVLFRTTVTASEAMALAGPDLRVVNLPTGRPWASPS